MHQGTIVQMPRPKMEQTSMVLVTELSSELYCEPCNLKGVAYRMRLILFMIQEP